MKVVSRSKVTYSFSPKNEPVENVRLKEPILVETEDAFGGQLENRSKPVGELDWSRVDGATGPLFIESTEPGDTLVVDILRIDTAKRGVIATIPKYGVLSGRMIKSSTKVVGISDGYVHFDNGVKIKAAPMIGTIGVAPASGEVPSGSLGRHGGNMDVKDMIAGARLYLPVLVEGALFAAGDVHAVQADGELCVSSVEVAAEVLLSFDVVKGREPAWPILETEREYAVLACGETLEDAAASATESMVKALMREHRWTFEKAYMFGSLAVDLRINQVVDPLKGVRAVVSKEFLGLESLLI